MPWNDRHKGIAMTQWAEPDRTTFSTIRERIAAYCGVYLDDSRRRSLGQVLTRRLIQQGLPDWNAYLHLLDSPNGQAELTALAEEVVNNETSFFRNPRHFRALAETVLPELDRARPAERPLRLWSAGCSTGQEAYSIAITVAEALGLPPRRPVQILASDLSRRVLEVARNGLYSERDLRRVEPDYRRRYFRAEGGGYRVNPALQQLIEFRPLNLVRPFPADLSGVDVVFCRNVTIYFRIETCRQLMARLYEHLSEGGYLFIGFSETLWQIFDAFERVQAGGTFFYRKGSAGRARPEKEAAQPRSVPGGRSVERPLYLAEGPVPTATPPSTPAPVQGDPARERYHEGMSALREGEYERALQAFYAALRAEPNLVEAHCGIAQVHANRGAYQEALYACERALELDDLAEEAYLLRGLVYRQIGRPEQAVADLERASYLNPASPTAHFYLGDVLLAQKEQSRALEAFRRAWRTLLGRPDDALIDGVSVYLLRQACQSQIRSLTSTERSAVAGR